MTYLRSEPFCDWLDVTCGVHDSDGRDVASGSLFCPSFIDAVESFLNFHGFPISYKELDGSRIVYSVGKGTLVLDIKRRFHRASASGSVVRELESLGIFRDYVNVLGSVPHNITRLDVAVDVYVDAPVLLRELESRYPDDFFAFGRKSLRVTRLYSARESDGALTGTWYAGHRSSARVTCRVYDKQAEALDKRSQVISPLTRYELTFKKDYNCSLYDVLMPESLFYSHASPSLLPPPEDRAITPWEPRGLVPWVSERVDTQMDLERFCYRLESSPELEKLAELASGFGEQGVTLVMHRFERLLRSALNARSSSELSD